MGNRREAIRHERRVMKRAQRDAARAYSPKGMDHIDDGVTGWPFGNMAVRPAGIVWQRTGGKSHIVTVHREAYCVAVLVDGEGAA